MRDKNGCLYSPLPTELQTPAGVVCPDSLSMSTCILPPDRSAKILHRTFSGCAPGLSPMSLVEAESPSVFLQNNHQPHRILACLPVRIHREGKFSLSLLGARQPAYAIGVRGLYNLLLAHTDCVWNDLFGCIYFSSSRCFPTNHRLSSFPCGRNNNSFFNMFRYLCGLRGLSSSWHQDRVLPPTRTAAVSH